MDILQLVDEQLLERYKHFIIFGSPLKGKSKIAKYISREKSGMYIDLLSEFQNNKKLKEEIDIFSAQKLKEYIDSKVKTDNNLVIIDHIDFLIHTWDQTQLQELITFVEMNESNYCCLFIMQDYKAVSQLELKNEKGNRRNINIFDIGQGGLVNG